MFVFVLLSTPPAEFNILSYKPDVVDAQLLLYVSGEKESGTGVSTQAVRYNEDHRAPTSPHKTPAADTPDYFLSRSFLHYGPVYKMTLLCLT